MEQARLPKFRKHSWRTTIVFSVVLIGLSILTGWNLTRSDAIADARRSYTRADLVPCLEHALDHLERRPWSREAALLAGRCLSRLDYAEEAEPYYGRAGQLDLSDSHIRALGLAQG